MKEKRTTDLENVLGKTHLNSFQDYCKNNQDSIASEANSFSVYVKDILYKNHITQQMCFLRADIPEKYGYKLLSGEKRTKQRDIILNAGTPNLYISSVAENNERRALGKKLKIRVPMAIIKIAIMVPIQIVDMTLFFFLAP